jgi:RimJ/RimL family protein N-acetyltransferase
MSDSEQPILRDGDLVLRAWRASDVEATRHLHDDAIAKWFGFPTTVPSAEEHSAWVERTRREWADGAAKATFLCEWNGEPVGSVDVRRAEHGVGVLSWAIYAPYREKGLASRAVRLLIRFAFDELGLERVEAHVNPLNRPSLRVAHRAGLRREGLMRGNTVLEGERHDSIVRPQGLLAVNWLPPWRGWTDATVFVFDLGTAPADLSERAELQPREIRALHWCGEEELEERVAPYNQRLLAFLSTHSGPTAYLEDGLPAL